MENKNSKEEVSIPENIKIVKLGFVNAYLIEGNGEFILVDTGYSKTWPVLEKELIAAGCLPDKLKLVVVTHGDSDHTGGCKSLQEKYQVKIAMHADDQALVESGFAGKRKVKPPAMRFIFFAYKILRLLGIRRGADKFNADIYLQDGQNLNEFGFSATVIHIPGHTKGSIAVLTSAGDLFVGDTMVNFKKPGWANIIQNEAELGQSIEKLKRQDIKIIYPGHGRPFLAKELFVSKKSNI